MAKGRSSSSSSSSSSSGRAHGGVTKNPNPYPNVGRKGKPGSAPLKPTVPITQTVPIRPVS